MGSGIFGSNFKVSTTYFRLRNQAFKSFTLNPGQCGRRGRIKAWERLEFISIYDNLGLQRKEATAMGT